MQKQKIILGIDPGTLSMGYSVVHIQPDRMQVIEMNVVRFSPRLGNYERLRLIHSKVSDLISHFKPDCFAIEAPFFGKNVQSMLKLGRAQGVAIAAAIASGLEVCEYSPRKVKQSITGNGNAGKEQVWKMLQQMMSLTHHELPFFDASDALAVAICHHFQNSLPLVKEAKKSRGWKEFVAQHPTRLRKL